MSERDAYHVNAVDRNGKRYTTHVFGFTGEWWQGATILTPGVIAQLRRDGLLPLTEIECPPRELKTWSNS